MAKSSRKKESKYSKRFLRYYNTYQTFFNILSFIALINIFGIIFSFVQGNIIHSFKNYFIEGSFLWNKLSFSNFQFYVSYPSSTFLSRMLETVASSQFISNPPLSKIVWYIISGLFAIGLSITSFILINKASAGSKKSLIAFIIFKSVDNLFLIPLAIIGESLIGILVPFSLSLVGYALIVLIFIFSKKMVNMSDEEKYNTEAISI